MEVERVLHIIGGLNRGGAETMAMNLYRAIDKNNIQFDFIVHSASEDAYFREVETLGGKIYVFPKFTGKNIFKYMAHLNEFLSEHNEYRIIHSHVRSYALFIIHIAKKHGVKTIVHSHSTSNGSGLKAYGKKILQVPVRYCADYLAACSQIAGEWLYGRNAKKKDNYIIIRNAIDTGKYKIQNNIREEYIKQLGVEKKHVYGHVGRLSEPKNHLFLLDIFADIKKRDQDAVLMIVGSGEKKQLIERKIADLNLQDSVILTGSRPDVPELLSVMDVFLFPSLWEGLPVTVVEAQAAGLPCLISDKITKEVAVSEAVKYLPIDQGTDIWVSNAMKAMGKRFDVINKIIESGYDTKTSAKEMADFYRRIINE